VAEKLSSTEVARDFLLDRVGTSVRPLGKKIFSARSRILDFRFTLTEQLTKREWSDGVWNFEIGN
jgi:hypothetical protein